MIYIYMVLQTLMPPQWTLVSHCFLAEVLACGLFTNSIYVFLTGISGTFPNSFIHLLTMWTGICRYFSLQSPGDQGAQTCIKQEPANEVGKLKLKEKEKKKKSTNCQILKLLLLRRIITQPQGITKQYLFQKYSTSFRPYVSTWLMKGSFNYLLPLLCPFCITTN